MTTVFSLSLRLASLLSAAILYLSGQAAAADFYAGKTVTIIIGFPPGGGVDAGARLLQRHLGKFIPGNPSIVVQHMPGASGLIAANHLYAKAERSGLTLGLPGRDWVMYSALQLSAAQFDALKYSFIGSTGAVNNYGWVRADLGIKSVAELKASPRKIVIGALSPATVTASVPNMLIGHGYPLQVVTGYRGTVQIVHAIEQNEAHGIFTNLATFSRRPDMLDKTVIRLFQVLPEVKHLPLVETLVPEETRPLMRARQRAVGDRHAVCRTARGAAGAHSSSAQGVSGHGARSGFHGGRQEDRRANRRADPRRDAARRLCRPYRCDHAGGGEGVPGVDRHEMISAPTREIGYDCHRKQSGGTT